MPVPLNSTVTIFFAVALSALFTIQAGVLILAPDNSPIILLIPSYIFLLLLIVLGGGVINHTTTVRTLASTGAASTRLRWAGIIVAAVAVFIMLIAYASGSTALVNYTMLAIGVLWLFAAMAAAFGWRLFYWAFVRIEVDAEGD